VSLTILQQYQQTLDYLYAQLPVFQNMVKEQLKLVWIISNCFAKHWVSLKKNLKAYILPAPMAKAAPVICWPLFYKRQVDKTWYIYTSPHLVNFGERIKINGKELDLQWVVDFVAKHKELFKQIEPSIF